MESNSARIERSLIKIVLVLAGAIVLCSVGGYLGMRMFRAWQERRLLAEANALVNEGDLKRASFDAQRVLLINQQSAGANRVLAAVGDRSGLHAAVDFRRRAAELSKNDPGDLLAWARSSLRFGDAADARKAIEMLPPAIRETAEYHALRADIALLERDGLLHEKELSRAVELDPSNKTYQLALASLHLNSAEAAVHDTAVHELEKLQSDETVRRDVTRRLVEDALRRREKNQALKYASQLNGYPQPEFFDRLLLLSALTLAGDAGAAPMLRQLQNEATNDAAKTGALLGWMNAQNMSREAVAWIQTLPPELLTKKTVPLTVADSFLAAEEWNGLQKFLRASNWGPAEYLRAALLARALRELGRPEESAQEWNQAASAANGRSEEIFLLAEMARKWGWEKEALDLLWMAADDPQKADQTLSALYRIYAAKGDSAELYRVLLHLEELRPNDLAILNNIAQLSLLLNLNTERAYELARRVHEENADNADYTSTYAFSLYRRGENKKAVQAFATIPDATLRRPQIAAYYGIILTAAGDFARARDFLLLGARANLLPEERLLLEKAQMTVAQR
jgi:hypothetical protein